MSATSSIDDSVMKQRTLDLISKFEAKDIVLHDVVHTPEYVSVMLKFKKKELPNLGGKKRIEMHRRGFVNSVLEVRFPEGIRSASDIENDEGKDDVIGEGKSKNDKVKSKVKVECTCRCWDCGRELQITEICGCEDKEAKGKDKQPDIHDPEHHDDSNSDDDKSKSKPEDDDDSDDKSKPELITEEQLNKMTKAQLHHLLAMHGKQAKNKSKIRKGDLIELIVNGNFNWRPADDKSKTTDSD